MNPADINPQDSLQLKDIHLPLSPELWPPAPGWWLLFITAVLLLAWLLFSLFKIWRQYRLQKEILAALDALDAEHGKAPLPEFLAQVSILLRRVAMMNFPAQQVAALTGKGWLSFLDLHGGGGAYSNGVGSALAAGPYASPLRLNSASENVDREALLLLTRKWVKRNTR